MRVLAVFTLSTALLLPVLASADPAQTQPPPANAAAPTAMPATQSQMAQTAAPAATSTYNGDEVICRMSPPTTGTRLGGGRECHTRQQWDQRQIIDQETVRAIQQPATLSGGH